MAKRYARINWQDAPSTNTPRNALFFNKMDKGIDDIDTAVENQQAQIDQLVVSGDSSPAAAQAAVGADGTTYGSLKTRLDTEHNYHAGLLAATAKQINLNTTNANVANLSANKADKSEVTSVMTPKGNIAYASLPTTGNSIGWYYYCPDGDGINGAGNYAWNGTEWYFAGTGDEGYNILSGNLINFSNTCFKKHKIDITSETQTELYVLSGMKVIIDVEINATESTILTVPYVSDESNIGIPANAKGKYEYIPDENGYIYVGGTVSNFKASIYVQQAYDDIQSVNDCFKKVTVNGECNTGIYVQPTDTVIIEVKNNATETTILTVPYSAEVNYINIPSNAEGRYVYKPSKSGYVYVGGGVTEISADIYKETRFDDLKKYVATQVGETPIKVIKGDRINVEVLENATDAQIVITPWQEGENYLEIPSGAIGKYSFITNVDGNVFVGGSVTSIKAIITKNSESDMIGTPLEGLSYGALGDSITYGVATNKPYGSIISNLYGLNFTNYGIGGNRLAVSAGHASTPMCIRYSEMSNDLDIITVMGGTNDFYDQTPIGTNDSTNTSTFKGALNVLMSGLQAKYPGKRIGFMTPIQRGSNSNPATVSISQKEYAEAMKEIGALHSIPVLDLYSSGGISTFDDDNAHGLLADGLHPNDKGQNVIARKIMQFIRNL